jgi:acid-activated urea channel
LLFVGITLIMNGINRFIGTDARSSVFMNAVTGFVIVTANLIILTKAAGAADYQNAASGFLFGFTYIFIAANHIWGLDWRPFGWFSLMVVIYAVVMAAGSFGADARLGLLWSAWALLWLEGFLESGLGLPLSRVFPYLSIAEGVFAAFVPAVFMLTGTW